VASAVLQGSATVTKRRSVLGCSVLCSVLVCTVLLCSVPARALTQDKLGIWLRAVEQHQPATRDEHAKVLASWTSADLNTVLVGVTRADLGLLQARLKRAAWLHADIAFMHRTSTGYGTASTGAVTAVVGDGQLAGSLGRTPHWAFARRLLDEARRLDVMEARKIRAREPAPDEDVRHWYRATSAFLQSWNEYVELVPHLTAALAAFPDDPVLLLIKGSMHEYLAEPSIQVAVEQQRRLNQEPAGIGSPLLERQTALRTLDAAIREDSTMVEARVRRANVLLRLGRAREAVDAVTPLLQAPPSGTLGYWIHLTHGRALLALDQLNAARDTFAAAKTMYPDAQTPRLALAQVAMRLGDVVRLEELTLRPAHADDPWLQYYQNHVPHADELVTRLRARWPR
jgi:tetratricopeptide (TPR) repeat protein